MYCPNCGGPVQAGERFCANCGNNQPAEAKQHCPSCGKEWEGDSEFCPFCGHSVASKETERTSFCRNCGHTLTGTASFCSHCGTSVNGRNATAGTPNEATKQFRRCVSDGMSALGRIGTKEAMDPRVASLRWKHTIVSCLFSLICILWMLPIYHVEFHTFWSGDREMNISLLDPYGADEMEYFFDEYELTAMRSGGFILSVLFDILPIALANFMVLYAHLKNTVTKRRRFLVPKIVAIWTSAKVFWNWILFQVILKSERSSASVSMTVAGWLLLLFSIILTVLLFVLARENKQYHESTEGL